LRDQNGQKGQKGQKQALNPLLNLVKQQETSLLASSGPFLRGRPSPFNPTVKTVTPGGAGRCTNPVHRLAGMYTGGCTPTWVHQGGIYTGMYTHHHTQGEGIYGRYTPLLHPSGRHIWEVLPLPHPSGRHIWEDIPLPTPLRETHKGEYTHQEASLSDINGRITHPGGLPFGHLMENNPPRRSPFRTLIGNKPTQEASLSDINRYIPPG